MDKIKLLADIHQCLEEKDFGWYVYHEFNDLLEAIKDHLPHGSGIDCDWEFTVQGNGKLRYDNAWHLMNENGYYDGYAPFWIRFNLCSPDEFELHFSNPPKNKVSFFGVRDYLEDLFAHSLGKLRVRGGNTVKFWRDGTLESATVVELHEDLRLTLHVNGEEEKSIKIPLWSVEIA